MRDLRLALLTPAGRASHMLALTAQSTVTRRARLGRVLAVLAFVAGASGLFVLAVHCF